MPAKMKLPMAIGGARIGYLMITLDSPKPGSYNTKVYFYPKLYKEKLKLDRSHIHHEVFWSYVDQIVRSGTSRTITLDLAYDIKTDEHWLIPRHI